MLQLGPLLLTDIPIRFGQLRLAPSLFLIFVLNVIFDEGSILSSANQGKVWVVFSTATVL